MIVLFIIFSLVTLNFKLNKDKTIEINIGYQSVTSQTWGALIVKNQKIFEKKLQKKYPNKKIKIIWHDEISGSVINTNMISNKIDIGFMGDMPLLLNMYKASEDNEYNATLIALDGKGTNGINQSIIISKDSDIKSVYDLKGKTISTPIGSSAHFMLMKILEKYNLLNEVEIIHQDVAMACQSLSANKTDAFAVWEPYPKYLEKEINAKKLIDGTESEVDYIAGVIVNNNLLNEDKAIVDTFIDSLKEAHQYIVSNKENAARIFSKESGFSYEIALSEIDTIEWDVNIKEKDIETLEKKKDFLKGINQIKEFDIKEKIYN